MLQAKRRGFLSSNYSVVRDDGTAVAGIDWEWFREAAKVVVDGRLYRFSCEQRFPSTFSMQQGSHVVARARSTGIFGRAFNVSCEGRSWQLKAMSCWRIDFGIFHDGAQIGSIRPAGWVEQIFCI